MVERDNPTSHTYFSQRLRLHYLDWGNEDAPTALLVHGMRDHCHTWDGVAARLRDRFHVVAPDLRGHGDSGWSVGSSYSHADYIYDLAQLVHQQRLAPVTIIAHSLGGNIALRYAGIYPETVAHECLPFRDEQGLLCVAFCDPFDPTRQAWANEQLRESALWVLVHRVTLLSMFAKYEAGARAMDDVLALDPERRRVSEAIEDLSIKSISEGTSPVVKLVHSTIYDAFKLGASDIHLEAGTSDLTIKYRIDGVLLKVKVVEGKEMAEQAISRIKVMSELDISERRIPQDGRFKLAVLGRAVDFRVSVMPSIHGEDSVIRILDKQSLSKQSQGLRLDMIGFDEQTVTQIRGLASEPYGLMLVTGPTGSGKTTSLYAVLNELNQGHDKIITIEDPVEYQLSGILQIPVNEKKGLTFSRGLRSILRHDPDKIMVGEIRDSETAQIAVQSALTGHLVLATVHANNVLDIIGRFIHMGVEPYNFVSALNGVIAQRLVRVLCPHCIESYHPDSKLLAASRLTDAEAADFNFRIGRGCKDCYSTGYKGRRAIAEVLLLTDEIREQIARSRMDPNGSLDVSLETAAGSRPSP